jgi:hypothetical protein
MPNWFSRLNFCPQDAKIILQIPMSEQQKDLHFDTNGLFLAWSAYRVHLHLINRKRRHWRRASHLLFFHGGKGIWEIHIVRPWSITFCGVFVATATQFSQKLKNSLPPMV